MRYLPFRILVFGILLPPFAYITTILMLEGRVQAYFQKHLEKIYLGDTKDLLNGNIAIQDAIERNINRYMRSNRLLPYGIKISVVVRSKDGAILYPISSLFGEEDELIADSDPMRIARRNFLLLDQGLNVRVDIDLPHNTVLSNSILTFYIVLSLMIISAFYRSGMRRERRAEDEKNKEIERLTKLKSAYTDRMVALARKREKMQDNYEILKRDLAAEKQRASKNEDELIDEIVQLEAQIERNVQLQEEQQTEIEALRDVINTLEKDARPDDRSETKAAEAAQKRFKVLYKNIVVNKRAISGFLDLSEELKIKGEEIVHQLNEDSTKVKIKRKVFHKHGNETVFEVIFGYRGRLYFRKNKDNKVEVLSIGTKNTQTRDLEYLDRL